MGPRTAQSFCVGRVRRPGNGLPSVRARTPGKVVRRRRLHLVAGPVGRRVGQARYPLTFRRMRYEKKRRDEKGSRQVPTAWQAAAVTGHVLQNWLVAALLERGALTADHFRNVVDPATGACRPVYEWHAFP